MQSIKKTPLFIKFYESMPLPAIWIGIGLMFLFGMSFTLYAYATGLLDRIQLDEAASIEYRAVFTVVLLVAYLPMAHFYLIKWSKFHWDELSTRLKAPIKFNWHASKFWGLSGILTMLLLFARYDFIHGRILQWSYWSLDQIIVYVSLTSLGWFSFRFGHNMIVIAKQFSRLAKHLSSCDLFDLEQYKPFAQQGVQSSLLMVGVISIMANITISNGGRLDAAIILGFAMFLSSLLAFLIPVWGLHNRISATKEHLLQDINDQICPLVVNTSSKTMNKDDYQKLSCLLMMESKVKSISTWPFNASNIGRFLFYLIIGLGSWVGAAMIERLLEQIL